MDNKGYTGSSFELQDSELELRKRTSTNLEMDSVVPNGEPKSKNGLQQVLANNQKTVRIVTLLLIHLSVMVYFIFASLEYNRNHNGCTYTCGFWENMDYCSGYGSLVILLGLIYYSLVYYKVLKPVLGKRWRSFCTCNERVGRFISIGFLVVLVLAVATFVAIEVWGEWVRLQSLVGIFGLVLMGLLFSNNFRRVNLRILLHGILAQFILGILLIKWAPGRAIFRCIGDKVATFLSYGVEGAAFIYGDFLVFEGNYFAFAVLPVIFFFSFVVSVLYYLGAMQWFVLTFGWVLQQFLGTTVCESAVAAADIFIGMSESLLTIKPYLKDLTKSEFHSLMVSGFATTSGAVFAAYIGFGAEPSHLITASVMAAPASLTFAKLYWPETEESKTKSDNIQLTKSQDNSLLDAGTRGASEAIDLILNVTANLIAFIAVVAFVNGLLGYFSTLLGFGVGPEAEKITLQYLFGYIFTPLSWAIGIPWEESRTVGEVIGLKTVVNEFVGFSRLGELKAARLISLRSAAIATFAVCGFANPSSIGIMIGSMSSMVPSRRSDITSVALRAFVAGSCVTFMTASIAGLLMTPDIFGDYPPLVNTTTVLPTF